MSLSRAGGASSAAKRVVVWSLLALAHAASAQPASELELPLAPEAATESAPLSLASLREHMQRADLRLEAIREEESRNGPHSMALIGELRALGLLYLEAGQPELAVESIQRALQVKRVNDGLYSLEQVPIIRQLIVAEQARGNLAAVDDLLGRLVRLARLNPDDLRSVPLLRESADRRLRIYEMYLDGDLPPEISISVGLGGTGMDSSSSNRSLAMSSLQQARRNVREAIGILLRHEAYTAPELRELETQLIHSYYLELTSDDPSPNRRTVLHALGQEAYRRLAAYSALSMQEGGSVVEFADALIGLGDWELLASRNSTALETYREAYDLLAEHGASRTSVASAFAPETPVALPAFPPNPLVSEETESSSGYVDVSFEVSKYGRSRDVEVVETRGTESNERAKDIAHFIARTRFRPVLTDGEASRASFVLRYHY